MLAVCLLVMGIFSRFIVHSWNFTPVIALALFGGVYLKKKQALVLPLVLLVVTDLILGYHHTIVFTWGSVLLITLIGFWVRTNKSVIRVLSGGLCSAVLFFLVSNFGVWLMTGMYPMTWSGLMECYTMAVPFFRGTLAGTLVYGVVLFGTFEAVAAQLRNTSLRDFDFLDKLEFFTNYTYQQPQFREGANDGKDIPIVPHHQAGAGLISRFLKYYNISLLGRYVGSRFAINDTLNATSPIKPYYVLDGKLSYNRDEFEIFLEVNNMLDAQYSSYVVKSAFSNAKDFYPSPEQNFMAGMNLKF